MTKETVVLYVEDDSYSREVLEIILRYDINLSEVTLWEDSHDIENRLRKLSPKPDVIFLDIHLKPYDGFEILAIIRGLEEYRNTSVIAMTASVMSEEVQTLKDSGFNGAIGKPIDQLAFPAIFDRILNGETIWYIAHQN